MDILNFISWIASKRRVVTTAPDDALVPIGIRTETRDDKYTTVAITVDNLASQLSGDRLVSDTRELVLDPSGNLTLNTGDLTIATDPINGDDIVVRATDRITIQGGDKLLNNSNTGGHAYLYAGDGSFSDGTAGAGDGGNARVYAGDAGTSAGGSQGFGGTVRVRGGYTTETGSTGGEVYVQGGGSADNIEGNVVIGSLNSFVFNPNTKCFYFPTAFLTDLGSASGLQGAKALITDSTVAASGNFGAIAVGGGNNVVPVFSDGNDWLIG